MSDGRQATAGALMLYVFRYLEATALPLFMKGFLPALRLFIFFSGTGNEAAGDSRSAEAPPTPLRLSDNRA